VREAEQRGDAPDTARRPSKGETATARAWQADEVIRRLTEEADQDELQELIVNAGDEAAEALQEWIR
jgi:hypothetical protein